MDAEFSTEQEQLRQAVRRFLAERAPISPYVRSMLVGSMLDDPSGTTGDVWRGLADLGLTGMLVPTELGGAGGGMVDLGVVLEELGRAVHPGPFVSSAVGAVTVVTLAGSSADQERHLPSLADGSTVGTLALYEPDRRYAWRSPSTTAGPAGSIDGTKVWVMDAAAADTLFVFADAPDGPAVFAVDSADPGVTIHAESTVDGTRRFATVTFDHAVGRRLEAAGTEAVARTLDRLGLALVVDGIGAAERALELTVAYAQERHQFGVPIGSFQAVQHLCADMLRLLEESRAGAYYALWASDEASADQASADQGRADQGRADQGRADQGRADEAHRAAVMAQAFASEALPRIGDSTIQVFGGVGFTWEHDAHLYLKRLLTMQSTFGQAGDHLDELASLLLD